VIDDDQPGTQTADVAVNSASSRGVHCPGVALAAGGVRDDSSHEDKHGRQPRTRAPVARRHAWLLAAEAKSAGFGATRVVALWVQTQLDGALGESDP
jgi:hypothetical protein